MTDPASYLEQLLASCIRTNSMISLTCLIVSWSKSVYYIPIIAVSGLTVTFVAFLIVSLKFVKFIPHLQLILRFDKQMPYGIQLYLKKKVTCHMTVYRVMYSITTTVILRTNTRVLAFV